MCQKQSNNNNNDNNYLKVNNDDFAYCSILFLQKCELRCIFFNKRKMIIVFQLLLKCIIIIVIGILISGDFVHFYQG